MSQFIDPKIMLQEADLHAKYRFGQNFLRAPWAHERMISALGIQSGDLVIELGAGLGHLTQFLLASPASLVLAVERDRELVPVLKTRFLEESRLLVHEADAKTLDYKALIATYLKEAGSVRVVGNIPYHLTSPIVFSLFKVAPMIARVGLLVQEEVATRMTAACGSKEYGLLSVMMQAMGDVRIYARVGRNAFFPPPRVDSAIVAWSFFAQSNTWSFESLLLVVRTCFQKRRKTLRNSLGTLTGALDVLKSLAIDAQRRPETLTPSEFIAITEALYPPTALKCD